MSRNQIGCIPRLWPFVSVPVAGSGRVRGEGRRTGVLVLYSFHLDAQSRLSRLLRNSEETHTRTHTQTTSAVQRELSRRCSRVIKLNSLLRGVSCRSTPAVLQPTARETVLQVIRSNHRAATSKDVTILTSHNLIQNDS